MDLKAKFLSETCLDPIEYLRQLRQTTEPIGGDTEYCEDGELVEYDVAIEAVKKANDAFIEKACKWFKNNWREYVNTDKDGVVCFGHWEKDFENYMKGE